MLAYHSSFTPSQSDGDTLEFLFVARTRIANSLLEAVRESAITGNKQQLLLIGPRGAGKTHLVALLNHRLRTDPNLNEKLRIAWLPEDPYMATYGDLLLEILRRVEKDYAISGLTAEIEEVLTLPNRDDVPDVLEALLLRQLSDRTLLLVAENLDDLLDVIGDNGQQKLRALIQTSGKIAILATTTSLSNAVTDRRRVFFGFFKLIHLAPLSASDAEDLLARLAERSGNKDLVEAIHSPMGRARIHAVHHLAGGNPRVYSLFFDFLTRESLDDLVGPFMKLIDELTPYYQARMSRLSPLQRRIVDVLRQTRGATSVGEIARKAMNTSQTISKQLGKLVDLGYVAPATALGRSSYYELREPMMRLCLDVKEMRGRSVELFIEFLRVWYAPSELKKLSLSARDEMDRSHFNEAAERSISQHDPVMAELLMDVDQMIRQGKFSNALEIIDAAICRGPATDKLCEQKADVLSRLGRSEEELLACWIEAAKLNPRNLQAWRTQSELFYGLGRPKEAVLASSHALELAPEDNAQLFRHSNILEMLNRHDEAKTFRQRALERSERPHTANGWLDRARNLAWLDQHDDAITAYVAAVTADPRQTVAWDELLDALREAGRYSITRELAERLCKMFPDDALIRFNAGLVAVHSGDFEKGLAAEEAALERDPASLSRDGRYALARVLSLGDIGRHQAALITLDGLPPVSEFRDLYEFNRALLRADILMWLDRWEEGVSALDAAIAGGSPHWSSAAFMPLANLLRRTQNPKIWARFVSAWLEVFARNKRLAVLGGSLVWRIRTLFSTQWLGADTARSWWDTWATLASGIEELALPLRLLKTAVEFKKTGDRRALLELPIEERGLLQPWLLNLARAEVDDLERDLLRTVDGLERVLAKQQREARTAAYWTAQMPSPTAADYARLVLGYGAPVATQGLAQLLPGDWQSLDVREAEEALRLLGASDSTAAKAFKRPTLSVTRIERRALRFSNWHLLQVHFQEEGRMGAIDAMIGSEEGRILGGGSAVFYDLIEQNKIDLEHPDAQSEYVHLFSNAIRGGDGRFEIVDDISSVRGAESLPEQVAKQIEPWHSLAVKNGDEPTFRGTVLYGREITSSMFVLRRSEKGWVQMIGDEIHVGSIPAATEDFDGPLRFVANGPRAVS